MRLVDKSITGARLRHCVAAFIDDIATHGKTWEQYVDNQKATLMALADARWLVTVEKMYLGYDSVEMLGHIVENGQVKPVPGKMEAIRKLTPPTTTKQIKSFLGLLGFYRRFIKDFAKIFSPLVALLSKEATWEWGTKQQLAFEGLK